MKHVILAGIVLLGMGLSVGCSTSGKSFRSLRSSASVASDKPEGGAGSVSAGDVIEKLRSNDLVDVVARVQELCNFNHAICQDPAKAEIVDLKKHRKQTEIFQHFAELRGLTRVDTVTEDIRVLKPVRLERVIAVSSGNNGVGYSVEFSQKAESHAEERWGRIYERIFVSATLEAFYEERLAEFMGSDQDFERDWR